MTALHSRYSDPITLADALAHCSAYLSNSIALLYSPSQCQLARMDSGELKDSQGKAIDLSHVFEAKIFTTDYELRWLNHRAGQGRAVFLSEKDLHNCLSSSLEQLTATDTIDQQYQVWGRGTRAIMPHGWGQLASARIGSLAIPIQGVRQDSYVYLLSREYLGPVDEFGNVAVIEERFRQLKVEDP